jgi:hypothetical protein
MTGLSRLELANAYRGCYRDERSFCVHLLTEKFKRIMPKGLLAALGFSGVRFVEKERCHISSLGKVANRFACCVHVLRLRLQAPRAWSGKPTPNWPPATMRTEVTRTCAGKFRNKTVPDSFGSVSVWVALYSRVCISDGSETANWRSGHSFPANPAGLPAGLRLTQSAG